MTADERSVSLSQNLSSFWANYQKPSYYTETMSRNEGKALAKLSVTELTVICFFLYLFYTLFNQNL